MLPMDFSNPTRIDMSLFKRNRIVDGQISEYDLAFRQHRGWKFRPVAITSRYSVFPAETEVPEVDEETGSINHRLLQK